MTTLSVQNAVEKQLRDHELPTSVCGYLIVAESFAYLIDDLMWEQGGEKQPNILLANSDIYHQMEQLDELQSCTSGLCQYQEWVEVTGLLKPSDLAAFDRQFYRIDGITIITEDEQRLSLNEIRYSR